MTQRSVLALSAGITAFALVLVAAVTIYMGHPEVTVIADAATNLAPTPTAEVAATDLQIQSLIDDREAIYRQRLEQANQQLQQANAQLQEAYGKLQALTAEPTATQSMLPQPAPAPPTPTAVVYPVSPEQAAAIALGVASGASLTRQPELVSFQGTATYEVQLDNGIIYIDANSSQVLYNGTTPLTTSRQASPLLGVEPGEYGGNEDGD